MNKLSLIALLIALTMTNQQSCDWSNPNNHPSLARAHEEHQQSHLSLAQQLTAAKKEHEQDDKAYQNAVTQRDNAKDKGIYMGFLENDVNRARQKYQQSKEKLESLQKQAQETDSDGAIARELQDQAFDAEMATIKATFARMYAMYPTQTHQFIVELHQEYNPKRRWYDLF